MTLAPGTKHGSYEILAPLGAGGMGEVYRARDIRLRREVALKALPAAFAADSERLARLEREARLLAALNHPNIAGIYGIEDSGDSVLLVLELVEGQTLAERLSAGPLPLEDALSISSQIASGLEAAHDAGVIHRDLKPANVKIRPDGSVKILDLGLARALEPSAAGDPSLSPTITSGGTEPGVILGTAAYMSPEQARGRSLDRRSDVFSFGCVLYECLTGKRAFPGETISDTLAAILRAEPDWSALPPPTPGTIRRLLRRTLEKDAKRRLRDIGDARLEIDEALASPEPEDRARVSAPARRRPPLLWALAGALLGIVATFSVGRQFGRPTAPVASPTLRAVLPLPPNTRLSFAEHPAIAVSPDGQTVIFRAVEGGISRLYRRDLRGSEAKPITGTEGGFAPFISPDGEWLGFFTAVELKKVPLAGGAPIRISLVTPVTAGGAWDNEGNIVFTLTLNGPLSRMSGAGGNVQFPQAPMISKLDASRGEQSHLWPQLLPEGRGILVTMVVGEDFQDFDNSQIVVLDPKNGHRTVVLEGSPFARYAAGQLFFVRGNALFRAPFDLSRLAVTGSPVPLAERVAINSANGTASFAVTPDGNFVYADGPPTASAQSVVVQLDRHGTEKPLPLPVAEYHAPRLSPDGRTLALGKCDGPSCKLVLYDLERKVLSPFTSEPGRFFNPVWSPNGRQSRLLAPRRRRAHSIRQERGRKRPRATPHRRANRIERDGGVSQLLVSGWPDDRLRRRPPADWRPPRPRCLARLARRKASDASVAGNSVRRIQRRFLAGRAVDGLRLGRIRPERSLRSASLQHRRQNQGLERRRSRTRVDARRPRAPLSDRESVPLERDPIGAGSGRRRTPPSLLRRFLTRRPRRRAVRVCRLQRRQRDLCDASRRSTRARTPPRDRHELAPLVRAPDHRSSIATKFRSGLPT